MADRQRSLAVIVDDQFTGRKILEELIQGVWPGLEVLSFAAPDEALEQIRELSPDLILTDYKMPVMTGTQFIRAVRRLPACTDVPIVMITVMNDRRIRYEALEAGATDFLTRPIDPVECRARCRNLLTMRDQQRLIKHRARWLEDQVASATREIRERERETLLRLAKAGEYRDEGTGNHVLRMARYSRQIAEALALGRGECHEIELAAPMHDIGKIGIPDHILLKPGRLDEEEWRIMQSHTSIGYEILKNSDSRFIQLGGIIALNHHERWDGGGYPNGLGGEDIPLAARIVSVADVYDALRSHRPYKRAWSREAALAYMRSKAGSHLDPTCVEAFMSRIDAIREIEENLRDPAYEGTSHVPDQ